MMDDPGSAMQSLDEWRGLIRERVYADEQSIVRPCPRARPWRTTVARHHAVQVGRSALSDLAAAEFVLEKASAR